MTSNSDNITKKELTHVGIIMDGNGRWAKSRGLPRILGHHEGVKAVERTVRAAKELKVRFLSLYAFSTENWKRPQSEVMGLMGLFR
ncbi:MAG: undecaprenyl diphosphate synthase family protein, partial [Synergistaceae bacterium]